MTSPLFFSPHEIIQWILKRKKILPQHSICELQSDTSFSTFIEVSIKCYAALILIKKYSF